MAEDFPMSLRQLLPLLDVVGHANKHLGKVAKFMRKYGDMNMFPVKIQVMSTVYSVYKLLTWVLACSFLWLASAFSQIPLVLTVYLLVSFKQFKFTDPKEPISFEVPSGFEKVSLEALLATSDSKDDGEIDYQDDSFGLSNSEMFDY